MTSRPPASLQEIQTWMVAAITGADVDARAPERVVTAGPRMTAAERLAIYRHAYVARLVECLVDDYPVVATWMGTAAFEALGGAYADRYPSTSPNLSSFGKKLPTFLGEAPEALVAAPHRTFAAEVAALEWSIVEVLHADSGTKTLELTDLTGLAPDLWATARLVKHDAVRFHRFTYPVNAFYRSVRIDAVVPDVPAAAPSAVLVYRKHLTIWRQTITPAMARVLEPLLLGRTLGEALAALEGHPAELEEAGRSLASWFAEWAAAGIFVGIERD